MGAAPPTIESSAKRSDPMKRASEKSALLFARNQHGVCSESALLTAPTLRCWEGQTFTKVFVSKTAYSLVSSFPRMMRMRLGCSGTGLSRFTNPSMPKNVSRFFALLFTALRVRMPWSSGWMTND